MHVDVPNAMNHTKIKGKSVAVEPATEIIKLDWLKHNNWTFSSIHSGW